jgi:hypothetical protein
LALRTVSRSRPLSSSARCARPACPRSGARPTKFRSERPTAYRGTQVSDKRSALDAVCRITSSAGPIESASSASCSGSIPPESFTADSGRCIATGSSRRDCCSRADTCGLTAIPAPLGGEQVIKLSQQATKDDNETAWTLWISTRTYLPVAPGGSSVRAYSTSLPAATARSALPTCRTTSAVTATGGACGLGRAIPGRTAGITATAATAAAARRRIRCLRRHRSYALVASPAGASTRPAIRARPAQSMSVVSALIGVHPSTDLRPGRLTPPGGQFSQPGQPARGG